MIVTLEENGTLQDAMYALALADYPSAELLDDLTRKFPDDARALTEFAIALTLDAMSNPDDGEFAPDYNPEVVSPMVSRVMSQVQNKIYELKKSHVSTAVERTAIAGQNPFTDLNKAQFRELATDLHMNVVLLSKIRDRIIDPTTVPKSFCRYISEKMRIPYGMVEAHLFAPINQTAAVQSYKSDEKPKLSGSQSFPDAVKGSSLTKEQEIFLLGIKD